MSIRDQVSSASPSEPQNGHRVRRTTEAEVTALLSAVDLSEQSAQDALARLDLRLIAEPEI